jgi:hypothetical protein
MKKVKLFMNFFIALLLLSSCSIDNDDLGTPNSTADVEVLKDIAVSGSWTITSFIDSGSDETADFNGYGFSFNTDGALVADKGDSSVEGSWSITDDSGDSSDDNSSDDHSDDDIDFNIFFASPPGFSELSEDWQIVSSSVTKIELVHISGGNGGTDHLIFEKI